MSFYQGLETNKWLEDKVKTEDMSKELVDILEKINPMEAKSSITDPVEDNTVSNSVKDVLERLSSFNFPGAQPVNMRRKNIIAVQSMPYYIAEKTDGVRYLMISLPGKKCVLVDRKAQAFRVN